MLNQVYHYSGLTAEENRHIKVQGCGLVTAVNIITEYNGLLQSEAIELLNKLYPVLLKGKTQVFAKAATEAIRKETGLVPAYFSTKGQDYHDLLYLISLSHREIAYVSTQRTDRGHIVMYQGSTSYDPYWSLTDAGNRPRLAVYSKDDMAATSYKAHGAFANNDLNKYIYIFAKPSVRQVASARPQNETSGAAK